ncbi:MAG: methyl-accepting chemotaxis protein [Deltaproteobacteria bacterium]|jgi:methyl-accepting chemotaxis protein|nr:methyl-accepting chemotaxis protein [Deltaproteobacteria bacterium]
MVEVEELLEIIYEKSLKSNLNARKSLLNNFLDKVNYDTLDFAAKASTKDNIRFNDVDKLYESTTKLLKQEDAIFDTVVVIDANGETLSKVNATQDLKINIEGKWALKNIGKVGIVKEKNILYFHAEQPVIKDGKVIGAVITGSDILSNNTFADLVKSELGIETTTIIDGLRYGTTFTDAKGQSLKGTKFEDQAFLQNIINNGKEVFTDYVINGDKYVANFSPIKDLNDKIVGVSFSAVSDAEREAVINKIAKLGFCISLTILAIFILVNFLWVRHILVKPLKSLTNLSHQLANWDLSQTIKINSKDELGELANSMAGFIAHIRSVICKLKEQSETINKSSEELTTIANAILKSNTEATNKLDETCVDVEEMNHKYASAKQNLESVTSSIVTISAAAEEMTSTIGEIANNSSNARNVTSEASEEATNTSDIIKELGQAAQEISTVTESISNISAQTNILALNATIEAARAGTAGKGFAVVANEIKNLAQETESATGNIHGKVNDIQESTNTAINNVESVTRVINNVNSIVTSIAAAIEEQSAVTKDISHNIGNISSSIQSSNETISEVSEIAKKVTDKMHIVSQIAEENTNGSSQIKSSADNLALLSEHLEKSIAQFKL